MSDDKTRYSDPRAFFDEKQTSYFNQLIRELGSRDSKVNNRINSLILNDISDVSVNNVGNGQFLTWSSAENQWVPTSVSGGSGATTLVSLTDVSSVGATDNQVLTYSSAQAKWIPTSISIVGGTGTVIYVGMTVPTGLSVVGSPVTTSGTLAITLQAGYVIPTTAQLVSALTSLSDVSVTGAVDRQILVFSSAQQKWIPTSVSSLIDTGPTTLVSLTDVSIAGRLDNQALTYSFAQAKWIPTSVSTPTPGGTDTQVQFNDGGSFGGDAGFTFNKTTNSLLLSGTISSGFVDLMVINGVSVTANFAANSDTLAIYEANTFSNTAGSGAFYYCARSRGHGTSIVAVNNGDTLGGLAFVGHDGTDYATGAAIYAVVATAPSDNDMPTDIILYTSPDGSQTLTERMRVTHAGLVNIAGLTASELVATDASKNLQSLAVSTYPSLVELAYVKGATSNLQTQINAKPTALTSLTDVSVTSATEGQILAYSSAQAKWVKTSISAMGQFGFVVDGNGAAVSVGTKGFLRIPYNGIIRGWDIVADQSGSIVIDVWKDTYANFPPTVADTIAGTEKPTLSGAQKNQDVDVSTWTVSVSEGDYLAFNVDSATTVQKVFLTLYVKRLGVV